jgi:hypothetical protein
MGPICIVILLTTLYYNWHIYDDYANYKPSSCFMKVLLFEPLEAEANELKVKLRKENTSPLQRDLLMLLFRGGGIIAVYYENNTKYINTVFGQNGE